MRLPWTQNRSPNMNARIGAARTGERVSLSAAAASGAGGGVVGDAASATGGAPSQAFSRTAAGAIVPR